MPRLMIPWVIEVLRAVRIQQTILTRMWMVRRQTTLSGLLSTILFRNHNQIVAIFHFW